jgi:hypothetical protein
VIKPQAEHKGTKNLSKDKPYHHITHNDDDGDDDNHLNHLPDTSFLKKQFGKRPHSVTTWCVLSLIASIFRS